MEKLYKQFLRHVGQTSPVPMGIEVERAEGIYLYTPDGKRYIDLISGVSVSNVGHSNPVVVDAVSRQAQSYMHIMVYGEMVERPEVDFALAIARHTAAGLDCLYYVNSGSEAIEGALKLAKRYTGRTELISFKNAYHGSTHGALSMMGSEYFKSSFRPLLPDVRAITFNDTASLKEITERTAAVLIEPIQGEGGYFAATPEFLSALRARCNEVGALLIFDEIQSGFGRTGKLFAAERYGIFPDILCMAKAMGGGMPLGGFMSSFEIMNTLTFNPVLGHITTFGGHPVSCAAGLAALRYIEDNGLMDRVAEKESLFRERLASLPNLKEIRSTGLMIALDFESEEIRERLVAECVRSGLITESFLFCPTAMRIAPPLTITTEQVESVCDIIKKAAERVF